MKTPPNLIGEFIRYDPETGTFSRIKPYGKTNARYMGGPIGTVRRSDGYRKIGFGGVQYEAGPLAWWFATGSMPERGIDHKNHLPDDNRFANLRPATKSQNAGNMRHKDGRYRGITRHGSKGWKAQITKDYRCHYIGTFKSPELAAAAYDKKAAELFGEFANLNFGGSNE